ncbi:FAD/NAD(P)-binding protein [Staphylococcus pettenkoferi]|uniref:FAD/NAD(P)-binding protein n=1 Tax=Staphylococcus pettenkoferi TaxID=170573 RepID=UPI00066EF6B7|nr:FAD/NAD(P)-binding protein [Staphylococcus pettenkoferi]MCY1584687.1 lysine N(6)-hydroxylase/L-ornithine N(5)-oxygenase family protein [Staphylococcus pettenkoferi]MCY1627619.1 lysine N(6)-hydroxylase/L-ornithine N(5)-oxygenase family protein [Staphylococcus pettenkoferi]PNZ90889.1 pyridine nucleotide-disulfide oxidoreductase [Staphylococcus pettenkoferi]QQC36941.1 SidA/IucD/PvdA family monooxygenase [Staphylococcus pettenkoferi]UIK47539.1 lysine N(6)-hydroxylase/L-ornithine N(5)-oxygenase 
MKQWTIIGGGIQAVTIAIKLRELGLSAKDLRLIDPHDNLCAQFHKFTERLEMPFLRSPCVHHVHPDPFHLNRYAKAHQYTESHYGRYQRPQRAMFLDHTHYLIHKYGLNESHFKGAVQRLAPMKNRWQLTLEDQRILESHYVIIASGSTNQPYIPKDYLNQPDVNHVFDLDDIDAESTSHIIGSGVSAAHLTLRLLNEASRSPIHLWLNKPISVNDFDADPGWLGPKYMSHFKKLSLNERHRVNQQERHRGSMPRELFLKLKKAESKGRLHIHINEHLRLADHHIVTPNGSLPYDHILLATGFEKAVLNAPFLQHLVIEYGAPVAQCGLPHTSTDLEWLPTLFVSGALADLELGPFARNIMGGREAAQRIGQAFQRASALSS